MVKIRQPTIFSKETAYIPVHYGSISIQGNNCIRVKYLEITFTFDIYLGTSSKEATAAKDSAEFLTGWWKDVFQIFGTSWTLKVMWFCGFSEWKYLGDTCTMKGATHKKVVLNLFKSRVWLASVQICQSPPYVFRPYVMLWIDPKCSGEMYQDCVVP